MNCYTHSVNCCRVFSVIVQKIALSVKMTAYHMRTQGNYCKLWSWFSQWLMTHQVHRIWSKNSILCILCLTMYTSHTHTFRHTQTHLSQLSIVNQHSRTNQWCAPFLSKFTAKMARNVICGTVKDKPAAVAQIAAYLPSYQATIFDIKANTLHCT